MNSQGQDTLYLIKSSAKIMGPYSEEELVQLLKSKQISLIDEVKLPAGRWTYLREEKKFIEVIQKIREEMDQGREDTISSSFRRASDEVTSAGLAATTHKKNSDEEKKFRDQEVTNTDVNIKDITKGTEVVTRVHKKTVLKKDKPPYAILTALSILFLAVIFYFTQYRKNSSVSSVTPINDKYKISAVGDFLDRKMDLYVLSILEKNDFHKIQDEDLLYRLYGLFTAYSKNLSDSDAYYTLKLEDPKYAVKKNEIYNFLGVLAIASGNLPKAETLLQKSIKETTAIARTDDAFIYPVINLGILQILQENYNMAFETFQKLQFQKDLSTGSKLSAAAQKLIDLGFSISFYHNFQWASSADRRKKFKQYEPEFDRIFLQNQKESYLGFETSYILFFVNLDFFQENLDLYYDQFMFQWSNDHRQFHREPGISWSWLEWEKLSAICKKENMKSLQTQLMKSLCSLKDHKQNETEGLLNDISLQTSKDQAVLLTSAIYLREVGRLEEAKSQLDMVLEKQDRNITGLQLLGITCLENSNMECAQKAFMQLNSLVPSSLASWIFLQNNQQSPNLENIAPIDAQNSFLFLENRFLGQSK